MGSEKCQRLNKEGNPCGNKSIRGSDFCFSHTFSRRKDLFFYIGLACSILTFVGFPIGAAGLYYAIYPPAPTLAPATQQKQAVRVNHKEVWQNVREGKTASAQSGPLETNFTDGATCQAWLTPVFNPYPVNYSDLLSLYCHDLPVIDVVLDTPNPAWVQSEEQYESIRKFSIGDQIAVGIYIDNGGVDDVAYTAKNVQIATSLKFTNELYIISTTFIADNAPPRTGSIYINTGPNARLEPVLKSGYMYDYQGRVVLDQQNLELLNEIYTLGDLDAGFKYSLFFTYKFRVVQA